MDYCSLQFQSVVITTPSARGLLGRDTVLRKNKINHDYLKT